MKKSQKITILILITFFVFFGLIVQIFPIQGLLSDNGSITKETSEKFPSNQISSNQISSNQISSNQISSNQISSNLTTEMGENNTINEWEQYEAELFEAMYDGTWGYSEWRDFVIVLGYDLGQLDDLIINEDWIQHNIHIATIIKWGKYNGSLTEEEITELTEKMEFSSTWLESFTIYPRTDEKVALTCEFGINGPEKIFYLEYWVRSETPEGKYWRHWRPDVSYFTTLCGALLVPACFDLTPFNDDYYTIWNIVTPYEFVFGAVEDNVRFRITYHTVFLGIISYHFPAPTIVNIRDDDSTPPTVNLWLYNEYGNKTIIDNNTVYDIDDIQDPNIWYVRIEASDISGTQFKEGSAPPEAPWENFREWGPSIKSPYPYVHYNEYSLSIFYEPEYADIGLFEHRLLIRDKDNDRPNDEEEIRFRYLIRRFDAGTPSPDGLTVVKIKGMHKRDGIYVSYRDKATLEILNSTCLFPYKEDYRKNEVTIELEFHNPEDVPIRAKIGGLIPFIFNIQFSLLENLTNVYFYDHTTDRGYYDGNRVDAWDPSPMLHSIFSNKFTVNPSEMDKNFHFWIELMPGETKKIELCRISADDIRLLNPNLAEEDFWDRIEEVITLGASIYKSSSKSSSFKSDSSRWGELGDIGQQVFKLFGTEFGGYQTSQHFISDFFGKLNPNYRTLIFSGKGALFPIYISLLEAYAAEEYYYGDVHDWWWHLNYEVDQFHYARGDPLNVWENIHNIFIVDPNYWRPDSAEEMVYYAGIGFVPSEHQEEALWSYLGTDYLSVETSFNLLAQQMSGPWRLVVKAIALAIGIGTDIYKNVVLMDIANGKDPPDYNFYETPDEQLINFPYEDFPDLYNAIQAQNPLAENAKKIIDSFLDLERCGTNILIATNRYNTAHDEQRFDACDLQTQSIREFSEYMISVSKEIGDVFIDLNNRIEDLTEDDPLHFTDDEMDILTSSSFEFAYDTEIYEFVEQYETIRNRDAHLVEYLQSKEQAINSIELDHQSLLNTMGTKCKEASEALVSFSNKMVEESLRTNEYIKIDKLGIPPSSDIEIEQDLQILRNRLENLAELILQEDYYNGILLAEGIMEESLDLYYNTLRKEFYSVYSAAGGFQRLAYQRNQIIVTLTDQAVKSVRNGDVVGFSFTIKNLIGQGIADNYDDISPMFRIMNLPNGLSYKIFHLDQELDKNGELYQIPLTENEIKSLRLVIYLQPNSNLELLTIPLTLEIFQSTPEKSMRSHIEVHVEIIDDDNTAPELSLSYSGGYTDGDLGTVAFTINDPDLGSDATAILSILDDAENIIFSNMFSEGSYTLGLTFLDIGQYTVILEGENNDEDGTLEDEEYSTISIPITIVDDDETAPIINIDYIGNGEDGSPGYFKWTLTDYDEGIGGDHDTGFSIIDIRVTYESTEGLPYKEYILPSIESGSWNLEPYLGKYTITIFARDNDDDRTLILDALSTVHSEYQHISDDDTIEPNIDFNILEKYWVNDMIYLSFSVTATDNSGIGPVDIQLGNNKWEDLGVFEAYFQPGYYNLKVSVTDADNDRDDDAMTATFEKVLDLNPPRTNILIGDPNIPIGEVTHIKPETLITFITDDSMASTWYRFLGVWIEYEAPFTLGDHGLSDGEYTLDYYSIDTVGNSEPINSIKLTLDSSAPSLTILNPLLDAALQDGVTFLFEVTDLTGVDEVKFSIREPGDTNGIVFGPEFAVSIGNDLWQYEFDTLLLPDGYYIIFAETSDLFGNSVSESVQFSIRNWAVLELLPSTKRNRAGRTMPVKFSLRVAEAVDSEMPFVWNEELHIIIYDESNPVVILQLVTYGDTSLDYRISSDGELYITNFKTSKTPAVYIVEIWRKDMKIGSFGFQTYKSKNAIDGNFYLLTAMSLVAMLGLPYLLLISKKKIILI